MSASDWRSISEYDYLKRLDRSGFAWEFLRRNAAYQEDFKTLSREAASDAEAGDRLAETLGQRWGLYFRRRSTAFCRSDGSLLAGGSIANGHSTRRYPLPGCAAARYRRAWRCDSGTQWVPRPTSHSARRWPRSAPLLTRSVRPATCSCITSRRGAAHPSSRSIAAVGTSV